VGRSNGSQVHIGQGGNKITSWEDRTLEHYITCKRIAVIFTFYRLIIIDSKDGDK